MRSYKVLHRIVLFVCFIWVSSVNAGQEIKLSIKSQSGKHRDPYFAVYLLDAKKRYVKTLVMLGADRQYYSSLKYWWRNFKRGTQAIDGVTGASLKNGDTYVKNIILPNNTLNNNYSIRVSSVAENGGYTSKEIVVKLSEKNNNKKKVGKKYVRLFKVKW